MSFFKRSVPVLAMGLCFVLVPASHAGILFKKKKKQVDLSANPLANVHSLQPDKELYDKAMHAMSKGHYDVARLDLQTLLNTYPDTEYAMRAKLAVGDTWYKEGGTAAMAQAEQEYKDFITFFPNTPEAAEAQMKVGDIYFSEMEKPDRDPQNAQQAEAAYRQMIEQFPDSPLVPRAKQRLREVQEVLAQRQFEIGEFYLAQQNWAASIARLQTVADNYPLFSHSDQTLISIGDAYAQQASLVQNLNIPAKAKAELVKAYDSRAEQAWDRVVTHYAMAPHVEEAKDRLIAAGMPIPEPTPAEMAESEAEEASRTPVHLKDRALMLIQHGPSTIQSVRVGEPTMADVSPVLAPAVEQKSVSDFELAMKGQPIPPPSPLGPPKADMASSSTAGSSSDSGVEEPAVTMENVPEGSSGGDSVGAEIVNQPGGAATANPAPPTSENAAPTSGAPDAGAGAPAAGSTGAAATPESANPDRVYGLSQPVGAVKEAPLPPAEKPAAAPDAINDVKSNEQVQVSTGTSAGKPGKKAKKPAYDHSKESSSKHHKKNGVDKLNPF
jgi:outer membrane protein assembly factor BamD